MSDQLASMADLVRAARGRGLLVHASVPVSRVVKSLEDLRALPVGTIVEDRDGDRWRRLLPDSDSQDEWLLIWYNGQSSSNNDQRTSETLIRNWPPLTIYGMA